MELQIVGHRNENRGHIPKRVQKQNCVVAKTLVFEMRSGVESSFALAGCVNGSKYAHSSNLQFPHLNTIMVPIL